MGIKRRDFVKGSAAASLFLLAGIDNAARGEGASGASLAADTNSRIEKSIRASFGGGFSVKSHAQSGGMTYAEIEHYGNRYAVASADLLNWKIIRSSLSNSPVAFSPISGLPIVAA